MQNTQQKLDQLLTEAIDEVLSSLGEPVKNQLYILLENDLAITKNTLPQQIAEFSKFLHRLFGSNARIIEIKCMKAFYSKIRKDTHIEKRLINFENHELTFLTYTDKLKTIYSI